MVLVVGQEMKDVNFRILAKSQGSSYMMPLQITLASYIWRWPTLLKRKDCCVTWKKLGFFTALSQNQPELDIMG